MSVYEHAQGSYRAYRVARSVNGKLRQAYFPRTNTGHLQAQSLDSKWAEEQAKAKEHVIRKLDGWTRKRKPPRSEQTREISQDRVKDLIARLQRIDHDKRVA